MNATLRFPDWYYGGPFLRVDNPDRDLPRRDHRVPVSLEQRDSTEQESRSGGERMVAPFRDANGVAEILAAISIAEGYPDSWDEAERFRYPTIQGALAVLELRIESKLHLRRGSRRKNWFDLALTHVREASSQFAEGSYEAAKARLAEAQRLVEQGNRASRRRTTFVVAPDGQATKL